MWQGCGLLRSGAGSWFDLLAIPSHDPVNNKQKKRSGEEGMKAKEST